MFFERVLKHLNLFLLKNYYKMKCIYKAKNWRGI
jgi:hypothetical protein